MATKDYALLDMQDENDEINLDFQEFPTADATNNGKKEQTVYFQNFPDSHADDSEEKLNLIDDEEQPATPSHSMWSFEYYQQYFNVNTKQVGDRVLWSMVPKPGVNYLESYIRPNPDLYGPFWISITLVFTTAIIGNLVNYLDFHGSHWRYDFHKVTLAASSIFSYTFLVPIAVWGILLWKGSRATFSLFELICIYGYSLSIFVPVSILWIVPLPWLQWCLGIVSCVVSGSVLIRTILSAVPHETQKFGVAAVVFLVHAGLALCFMLVFFNNPSSGLQPVMGPLPPANGIAANATPSKTAILDDVPILRLNPSPMTKRNEKEQWQNNISMVEPSVMAKLSAMIKMSARNPAAATAILPKATISIKPIDTTSLVNKDGANINAPVLPTVTKTSDLNNQTTAVFFANASNVTHM